MNQKLRLSLRAAVPSYSNFAEGVEGMGYRSRFTYFHGFTLVELLIVMAIIGILSGMVLLAVTRAGDKAEAERIIEDLSTYKSAAMLYYADHEVWPDDSVQNTPTTGWTRSLDAYVGHTMNAEEFNGVRILVDHASDRVLIGLEGTPHSGLSNVQVQEALKNMARATDLFQGLDTPYSAGSTIYMPIR